MRFLSEVGLAYQSPPPPYTSRPIRSCCAAAPKCSNNAVSMQSSLTIVFCIKNSTGIKSGGFGTQPVAAKCYGQAMLCLGQFYFFRGEVAFRAYEHQCVRAWAECFDTGNSF